MNKKIPLFLLGICHGEQEKILFKELTSIYLASLYSEIGDSAYDLSKDNPLIRVLSRERVEKVSVSTFKKDVKKRFPCNSLDYNIKEEISDGEKILDKGKESLAFITFIDFNEINQNTREKEKQLLMDNGLSIIQEIMDEQAEEWIDKSSIHSTLVIHADGAIERWLPNYINTNDKVKDMYKWIKENITKKETLDTKVIRSVIEKIDREHYNLIDYLDYLDQIFKEYI